MSFGSFYISGLQTGTPSGGQQSLGPFAVAFDDVVDTYSLEFEGTEALACSGLGVWIIPSPTNANAIILKGATGDTGISISPSSPTYIAFNPQNAETFLYLTTVSTTSVVIQNV